MKNIVMSTPKTSQSMYEYLFELLEKKDNKKDSLQKDEVWQIVVKKKKEKWEDEQVVFALTINGFPLDIVKEQLDRWHHLELKKFRRKKPKDVGIKVKGLPLERFL